jgi:hypothetical protein
LDLLRWERRFAHLEGSGLPDQYRAAYGQLLAYTPIFRPALESLQQDLLDRSNSSAVVPELQAFLAALNHYIATVESARAFVKSVVSPPMELVFHDTETFLKDWKTIDHREKAEIATELNDTCQFLLYDPASFHQSVRNIQSPLSDGVDASLYILPVDQRRIIFTMDEDPVFGKLIVTLLRLVPVDRLDTSVKSLIDLLYRDLSRG